MSWWWLAWALAAAPSPEELSRFEALLDRAEAMDEAVALARSFLERAEMPVEEALALRRLASALDHLGAQDEADHTIDAAVELAEQAGLSSEQLASLLLRRSSMRHARGMYAGARTDLERLLELEVSEAMREAALLNLSVVQGDQGEIAQALVALDTLERAQRARLGPDHEDTLVTMVNRAGTLYENGLVDECLDLATEATERLEALAQDDTSLYATALYNRAICLDHGKVGSEEARQLLERTLELRLQTDGPQSLSAAESLYALAVISRERGDAPGAIVLLERAIALTRASMGPEHPLVDWFRTELAWSLWANQERTRAVKLVDEAIASTIGQFGAEHPSLIARYALRGSIAMQLGNFEQAERDLTEALRVARIAWQAEGSSLVGLETELMVVRSLGGEAAETAAELQARIAAMRGRLGSDPDNLSLNLRLLSIAQEVAGDEAGAIASLDEAVVASEHMISVMASGVSDRERRASFSIHRGAVDRALMLRMRQPEQVRDYEMVLRWKAAAQRLLVPSRSAVDPNVQHELDEVRAEIAHWTLDLKSSPAARRQSLLALTRRKDSLERGLAQQDPFEDLPSVAEVCSALPEGSVLVDYSLYWAGGYHGVHRNMGAQARYVAFVLRGGDCDAIVHRVDLGPAEALEALARQVQHSREQRGDTSEAAAKELSRRLWSVLEVDAASLEQLFIAPDGRLAAVSFAGLLSEEDRYLVEDVPIRVLSEATELLRPAPPPLLTGTSVVVGGVDYGNIGENGPGRALASCGFGTLPPLPGTQEEAKRVAKLLGRRMEVHQLSGAGATEQAVAVAAEGAAHLHLATHGFLANEQCLPRMEPLGEHWGQNQVSVMALNPLALSGVVLAPGAGFGQGDGIWSAEEVTSLTLAPGALVVLSACDSGLGGELAEGAGVLGLGRAFSNAGAGQVVMSLWAVPDGATQRLMTDFYRGLSRGRDTADALREAQLRMLRSNRRRGHADPISWAGFVVSGWVSSTR